MKVITSKLTYLPTYSDVGRVMTIKGIMDVVVSNTQLQSYYNFIYQVDDCLGVINIELHQMGEDYIQYLKFIPLSDNKYTWIGYDGNKIHELITFRLLEIDTSNIHYEILLKELNL